MSAPPAYSTPPATNPDRRPLPDGYITRYDENYRAWYYVWTRSDPPRSSWVHPLDSQPQSSPPPQGNFAPPSNPPPDRPSYSSGGGGGGGGGGRPYNPSQPASVPFTGQQQSYQSSPFPGGGGGGGGYPGNTQEPRYTGYPAQPNYGAPSPNYGNQWQNWSQQPPPQPVYVPQTQPQVVQQSGRSRRNHGGGGGGGGMGLGLAAGAAGLVGGALLAEGYEQHEDEVRQEAYDQGFSSDFGDGTGFDGDY